MEIQATPFGRNTKSPAGRRHIAVHLERPAHKCVGPDLVALLHPSHTAKRRVFANADMPPKLAAVGYDRMSPNFAVVAHVGVCHNQHSIGNAGATAPLYRPSVERNPSSRKKEELDIAALGKGTIVLCECKYRSEPMEKSDIETLIRRSKLVKSSLARELMAFSRSGFTDGARRCAESNGVILHTLEDISRPNRDGNGKIMPGPKTQQ